MSASAESSESSDTACRKSRNAEENNVRRAEGEGRLQQGPNIYQIKFEPDLPEDVLIAADVDGMEQRICGEDIYPYWEYIYENEGGFVETDGRYILCVLHTAGMQGGVVMFWDTAEEELVHVSDGAYCVAAVLYEGEVYTLQLVEHFMTEPHFAVSKVPFGTMDCFAETDPVEWDIPVDMETFSGQTDDIKLYVSGERIAAFIDGCLFVREECGG